MMCVAFCFGAVCLGEGGTCGGGRESRPTMSTFVHKFAREHACRTRGWACSQSRGHFWVCTVDGERGIGILTLGVGGVREDGAGAALVDWPTVSKTQGYQTHTLRALRGLGAAAGVLPGHFAAIMKERPGVPQLRWAKQYGGLALYFGFMQSARLVRGREPRDVAAHPRFPCGKAGLSACLPLSGRQGYQPLSARLWWCTQCQPTCAPPPLLLLWLRVPPPPPPCSWSPTPSR